MFYYGHKAIHILKAPYISLPTGAQSVKKAKLPTIQYFLHVLTVSDSKSYMKRMSI